MKNLNFRQNNKIVQYLARLFLRLDSEQIATIVAHSGALKKWLGKVEDHALAQATDGHTYPGLKVVEGRSVRKYTDEDAVAQAVQQETSEDPYQPRNPKNTSPTVHRRPNATTA